MSIDGCVHDFTALANRVLPAHMIELEREMKSPIAMAAFSEKKVGVQTLLKRHGHGTDFSGCYVMLEDADPIYVGISRKVFSRLRQHVTDRTHYGASLAYRMAQHALQKKGTRGDAMKDAAFRKMFDQKQTYLRSLDVAMVAIKNPVELYLFEVFAALTFKTSQWNTFETH